MTPSRRARVAPLVLVLSIAAAAAAKPHGADVHRRDADCRVCHTLDAAALNADPSLARGALVADLEARCATCHDDEGPSHKTGVRPMRFRCSKPRRVSLAPILGSARISRKSWRAATP